MKSSDEVLFLFEGSHALDNDRVQDDLRKHPEREPRLKAGLLGQWSYPVTISSFSLGTAAESCE